MARWLALDLSLSSTGFASWESGDPAPAYGHWKLADTMKWRARGYCRLHQHLLEIHRAGAIDYLAYEAPLSQASVKGGSNIETIQTLAGLAAHAESFAAAVRAGASVVNVASWRRHFIGAMPRGTKSPDLKAMTMKRCRELGFAPLGYDEADAIGILDFHLHSVGMTPPWRVENVLQRQLHPATDGKAVAA